MPAAESSMTSETGQENDRAHSVLLRECRRRCTSFCARTAGSPTGARPAVIVRAFTELFRLWRTIDRDLRADPRSKGHIGGDRDIARV